MALAVETLQDGSIDAGLALLEIGTPAGSKFTLADIAYVCGCSKTYIGLLQKQAIEKLRRECERRRQEGEL